MLKGTPKVVVASAAGILLFYWVAAYVPSILPRNGE